MLTCATAASVAGPACWALQGTNDPEQVSVRELVVVDVSPSGLGRGTEWLVGGQASEVGVEVRHTARACAEPGSGGRAARPGEVTGMTCARLPRRGRGRGT